MIIHKIPAGRRWAKALHHMVHLASGSCGLMRGLVGSGLCDAIPLAVHAVYRTVCFLTFPRPRVGRAAGILGAASPRNVVLMPPKSNGRTLLGTPSSGA